MDNTKIGNSTEKTTSGILKQKKYWIYNCPKSNSGSQPFDLIAIRGNPYVVWLIDSKHVRQQDVSFTIDRIEPNQWASMDYAINFAQISSENVGFVIEFARVADFYWLPYEKAVEMRKNEERSINLKNLRTFEEILNEYDCKR